MSLSASDVSTLAGQLVAARMPGGKPLATPARLPQTLDDAYAVQDRVLGLIGPAAGWKVGAATPDADPVCAPILAGAVRFAEAGSVPVPPLAGVEIEIAFRFAKSFPAATAPPARDAVLAAIGSAHIVIETCARRVADKSAAAPPLLLAADNIQNHGLVIGPAITQDWTRIDLGRLVARISADGEKLGETKGGHTSPDLVRLLVWQVGHCVTRRGGLLAGTVITTGAWTGMHMLEIAKPRRIAAEFVGLAHMDITIAA